MPSISRVQSTSFQLENPNRLSIEKAAMLGQKHLQNQIPRNSKITKARRIQNDHQKILMAEPSSLSLKKILVYIAGIYIFLLGRHWID